MTDAEFKLGYATLMNAFALSDKTNLQTQDIYWQMLKKLPGHAFMNAVTTCLEECEFFPTIAKIKEVAARKPFTTGVLKQLQLVEPTLTREEAKEALKKVIEELPESPGKFSQFNRQWSVVKLPCIKCGCYCLLPFADGNEKCVLCEECREIEAWR